MDCVVCRGACCETFSLPVGDLALPNDDAREWLRLHARLGSPRGWLEFECRCTQLQHDGTCGIYETRPLVCRLYPSGGRDCLETVRTRRTRAEYEQIRQAGDPAF